MKFIFRTLVASLFITVSVLDAKPSLSKNQMIKIRDLILSAKGNNEYKNVFATTKPKYNSKKKLWEFLSFPVTPGGASYRFEYRESDGHYILGWLSTTSSKNYEKFRIQSTVRRQLRVYLKSQKQKTKMDNKLQ